jgi:Ca2+-binding EF-hand superfamily protein
MEGHKGADYWWSKYSSKNDEGIEGITMDAFIAGWREEDSGADESEIVDTFHSANWDGDYILNYDEFSALFTQMEQRGQGEERRDDRGVDYWWDRFANWDAVPAMIDFDGFRNGMMEADERMSEEEVMETWNMADQDQSGMLSYEEFARLFKMMEERENERRGEREGRGRYGDEGEDGMRGFEFNDGLPNARQLFNDF